MKNYLLCEFRDTGGGAVQAAQVEEEDDYTTVPCAHSIDGTEPHFEEKKNTHSCYVAVWYVLLSFFPALSLLSFLSLSFSLFLSSAFLFVS